MTAKILHFTGDTTLDIAAERVLDGAMREKLSDVVVIGYTESDEFYFASSMGDVRDVLWLLEQAKKRLLEMGGA